MGREKRRRQKENRRAARDAALELPELTDDVLAGLTAGVTVRADCEHASTRETGDSLVLVRCHVGAAVAGGCPVGCERFEGRRAGPAYGFGAG